MKSVSNPNNHLDSKRVIRILLFITLLTIIIVSNAEATVTQYNLTDGNYTIHIFNGTGLTTWTAPTNLSKIRYLVVAGGGGGGGTVFQWSAGGGGAGGLRYCTSFSITSGDTYNITVGVGGAGGDNTGNQAGFNGGNSSFANITSGDGINAQGGGGGGSGKASPQPATSGGSGGGGGGTGTSGASGVAGQGNSGGAGYNTPKYRGGGGGGAGAGGATGDASGNGGAGVSYSITGSSVTYAGGGGGGVNSYGGYSAGTGGSGGGGNGKSAGNGYNGTDAQGGGGGGAGGDAYSISGVGGYGGSGVVILRYLSPDKPPVADFTSNTTSGCTPLVIQFNDTSEGVPLSWNWSFGDGTYSDQQNPIKTYSIGSTGTYDVVLTVTNPFGINSTTRSGYISINPYCVVTFNTVGSTTWTVPANVSRVEYLVIAGGGSGGTSQSGQGGGGGGGAGGYITGSNYPVTPGAVLNVTVGGGGAGRPIGNYQGYSGQNSSFANTTSGDGFNARGGGGGGAFSTSAGLDGGSGGGAGWGGSVEGLGTTGQGYAGAHGGGNDGGGGGGASAAGFPGNSGSPRYAGGGNGTASNITGTITYYAGGGGAGDYSTVSLGGNGGGGNGSDGTSSATNGTAGTGGGGGAGYGTIGASGYGGSGIVIIKFTYSDTPPVADFTSNSTRSVPSSAIQFNDTSKGMVPTSWNWSFGDGTYSDLQNPVKSYSSAGVYTVNLTASNSFGSNTTSKTNYMIITYTMIETFSTVGSTTWTVPANVSRVEYLVVAGGGSGGASQYSKGGGGGGGAGGYLNGSNYVVTPGAVLNITVGGGGAGRPAGDNRGYSGQNSSFANTTSGDGFNALGGGGGGAWGTTAGLAGGSGGGAGWNGGSAGAGTAGQGNSGGTGAGNDGGGGGGKAAVGFQGNSGSPRYAGGGNGTASNITGTITYYAGGGGAGDYSTGSLGGVGGGGNGSDGSIAATSGTTGTGGGGGGDYGGVGNSGSGGSGIVILKYTIITTPPTTPDFTSNVTSGSRPFAVQFNDTSDGLPIAWNWSFGDGTYSDLQNPIKTYGVGSSGFYNVTLIVTNIFGSSSITKTNYIYSDYYAIVYFNTTGTTSWTAPISAGGTNEYLIVAGGGGGGGNRYNGNAAGGGGAGGIINGSITIYACTTYSITVGAGGLGGNNSGYNGLIGGNSSIIGTGVSLLASGGGGGGGAITGIGALVGGSGGGGGTQPSSTGASGTAGQGSAGGNGYSSGSPWRGGGGGGKTQVGAAGNSGGKGGDGVWSNITGTNTAFGGGGGGGCYYSGAGGSGGLGGGGSGGGSSGDSGVAGTNKTGGGGGGGGSAGGVGGSGGLGGSGIIILKYYIYDGNVTANFTSDVVSGTFPLTVHFTETSVNETVWNWSFGDGSVSSERNPTHTYTNFGYYTVNLSVTNGYSTETISKTDYIHAIEPITAAFTSNITAGASPLVVQFTDLSNNATTWNWTFGDGDTSTLQNPTHTYTSLGSKNVVLNASNGFVYDVEMKMGYITVSGAAMAGFSGDVTSGLNPLTVHFTDTSTNATSWYWDFGDGSTSTLQSPTHTYANFGTYSVNQTVSNAYSSDYELKSSYISVYERLIVSFTQDQSCGVQPLTVTFTDLTVNATTWNWTFGDGSSSSDRNPVHSYTDPGLFDVALTATSMSDVNSSVKADLIEVSEILRVNFIADDTDIYKRQVVTFTDMTEGNPTHWYWDFGDMGWSTLQNPTHQYLLSGRYNVSLTAGSGSCGYTNSTTKARYIEAEVTPTPTTQVASGVAEAYPPHQVRFLVKDIFGQPKSLVSISATVVDSPTPWLWFFNLQGITNTTEIPNTTLSGMTGSDGSWDSIIYGSIRYRVTAVNTTQGINEEMTIYPKESEYIFYILPTQGARSFTTVNGTLWEYQVNSTHERLGLNWSDSANQTNSLHFYVRNESRAITDERWIYSTSNVSTYFDVPIDPGKTVYWGYAAQHAQFTNEIRHDKYLTFEGTGKMIPLGSGFNDDWYNWISMCLIGIVAIALGITARRFAVIATPLVADFLKVIGWFPAASWILLSVATALGVLYFIRTGRRGKGGTLNDLWRDQQ